MSPRLYSLIVTLHGHVAWLGIALLAHPTLAILRGRDGSGVRLTAWLGALLVAVPYAVGFWIYPTYRVEVKPALLDDAHAIAMAFEVKEHLAWMCAACAVTGAGALLVSSRGAGGAPGRQVAAALLGMGFLAGVATGALGVVVASITRPGW